MIAKNLEIVKGKIKAVSERLGRTDGVRLVLVSKTMSVELIQEAYNLGCRDFGENKVQEWLEKKGELPNDIRWHMIGHLQTNKVKYCVGAIHESPLLIHSVDSLKLAQAIEKEAAAKNRTVDCLMQVNTSGEASKFGVSPNEAEELAEEVSRFSHLKLKGLMTIGPLTDDQKKTRESFRALKILFEKIKKTAKSDFTVLSMGMSSDFEIAIEEGSNLIRIGTAVFGPRT